MSEPQARMVKSLSEQHRTVAYINVHSGEWAVYTPWDSKPAYGPGLPVSWHDVRSCVCV